MALFDIDVAISAHKNWCKRLEYAIDGISNENLEAEKIADDRLCVLGGWLFGKGGAEYADFSEMKALVTEHRNFHQIASEIVVLVEKGQSETATARLSSDFASQSEIVVGLLMKLRAHFASGG